jgi:hypothetical protein
VLCWAQPEAAAVAAATTAAAAEAQGLCKVQGRELQLKACT